MQKVEIFDSALMAVTLLCCIGNGPGKAADTRADDVQTVSRLIRDTIHDTVAVTVQNVVYRTPSQVKRQLAEYSRIIEQLGMRVKDLEYVNTTSVSISDSVKAFCRDSLFSYQDDYISLRLNMADSVFRYSCKDSLTASISPVFRHRFLFWRWGIKGYNITLVPSNPHATILYNQFIKVDK